MKRRTFLKSSAASALAIPHLGQAAKQAVSATFAGADSLVVGPGWESLNPGYWQIRGGALRRRLKNYGDRARRTGFPYHYETHQGGKMPTEYDPSIPHGILWRRDWKLEGNYRLSLQGTVRGNVPEVPEGDRPEWKMYRPGYGMLGIAFGGKSLLEGYGRDRQTSIIGWTDDGALSVIKEPKQAKGKAAARPSSVEAFAMEPGDPFTLSIEVGGAGGGFATVTTTLKSGEESVTLVREKVPRQRLEGYVGIAGRGLLDFEINQFSIEPGDNQPLEIGHADCCACYPLGDSLKNVGGDWRVKFVAVFASDGERAEVRVADSEQPAGGWEKVPAAGSAAIVDNAFRRNT
ncbi:MAG: hypothetical protein ACR2RV_11385 [Verrucomicrobiales bacterium]